jgi:hypothetical protein
MDLSTADRWISTSVEGNSVDNHHAGGLSLGFGSRLAVIRSSISDGVPTEQGGRSVGFARLAVTRDACTHGPGAMVTRRSWAVFRNQPNRKPELENVRLKVQEGAASYPASIGFHPVEFLG